LSTLHTVNKSPYERFALASCLAHVAPGDALLMLEDGVLGARRSGAFAARLAEADRAVAVYAIGPDLEARGVKREDVAEGVEIVGYEGFVDLVANHARVCAWL
jgi:tRNA 2-thiouridine synthesizing protein B